MRYLTTALCLLISFSFSMADQLKAGAFAQRITPEKLPISLNGGMSDRLIDKISDHLHARALVLDDGTSGIAIVVVDSCMLPRELVENAKQLASKATKIPVENILISATHTHSAPTSTGVFQSDPDMDYVKFLTIKIAAAIETAWKRREPAQIGFISASNSKQVFNRRWFKEMGTIRTDPFGGTTDKVQMNPGYQAKGLLKPAGPIDPEIAIVAVKTLKGNPLALLANYSLHYVGGNPGISADYFGAFAEMVQSRLAPKSDRFVAMMSNGTSGDINNINFAGEPIKRAPGEQIRIVAEDITNNVLQAWKKAEFIDSIRLSAATADLQLGVRKADANGLARAKEVLALQKDPKKLAGMDAIYARESQLLDKYPNQVPVKVQVLKLGDQMIAAIPCEVFVEIGLELKRTLPAKRVFTIELANGYNGYLPTPAQHELGGYETWRARSSYLETGASPVIVKQLQELAEKLK
ncbi:MAG: hypothetical protein R3B84_12415 [Zavarzinella sp.]